LVLLPHHHHHPNIIIIIIIIQPYTYTHIHTHTHRTHTRCTGNHLVVVPLEVVMAVVVQVALLWVDAAWEEEEVVEGEAACVS
jgi:hypothetical protein